MSLSLAFFNLSLFLKSFKAIVARLTDELLLGRTLQGFRIAKGLTHSYGKINQ